MRKLVITLIAVLVFACSNNSVPKGILSAKKMIPVLVDIHLAEGIYGQKYMQKITRENYQEDLYLSVIKKYKLDQKVFEESVLYYGKHPDKYKPVYDEVLNRLNEMEVRSKAKDSIQNVISRAKDSIQNVVKSRAKDSIQNVVKSRAKDFIQHAGAKDSLKKVEIK